MSDRPLRLSIQHGQTLSSAEKISKSYKLTTLLLRGWSFLLVTSRVLCRDCKQSKRRASPDPVYSELFVSETRTETLAALLATRACESDGAQSCHPLPYQAHQLVPASL